jgi:hypothetical protein
MTDVTKVNDIPAALWYSSRSIKSIFRSGICGQGDETDHFY